MSEKESIYDLQKDMKDYLMSLIEDCTLFVNSVKYEPVGDGYTDITYIKSPNDLIIGMQDGLCAAEKIEKNNIKEVSKLRSNTKNYIKKYYDNGLVKEIETFVDGEFDCRFMAVYREGKRYLIPFSESGEHYPAYVYVLQQMDDYYEEYMVRMDQIIYRKYTKVTENKYDYIYINYVSEGTYPIFGIETGVFDTDGKITYSPCESYSWYDEYDAKRKNNQSPCVNIPCVIRTI